MAINMDDTAWVLAAMARVMLMTPVVGLFYGGLVSSKTVVSMIGLSFLALGQDISGIIGCLNYTIMNGMGLG